MNHCCVACDLTVGRYRQLIDLMELYVIIQGQGHFLTLTKGKIIYQELGQSKPKFVWFLLSMHGIRSLHLADFVWPRC